MAPPQAPANGAVHGGSNGGVVVAGGGTAPSSENGAGGHHGGSIDGVVGGTTVPSSVAAAANGNGKQHGTRKQRRPAVSPMDKYWTPIDDKEAAEAVEDGGEDGRRPLLFRTYRVKGILLHPYSVILGREMQTRLFVKAHIPNMGLRPSMLQCEKGRLAHRSTPSRQSPLPLSHPNGPDLTGQQIQQANNGDDRRRGDSDPTSADGGAAMPSLRRSRRGSLSQLPLHSPGDFQSDPPPLLAAPRCTGRRGALGWRSVFVARPARLLTLLRLIAIILFFIWRIRHPHADGMWLWWISIVGDFWFGVTWLLNQVAKLNPIKRVPDLSLLRQQFDLPDGNSNLPRLDVFINTVDPINEPMIYTMNSILSILAVDYPIDRTATYLSDDGGSIIHYEGLLETANFATLWVPFCRKHSIEPRAPESYFAVKSRPYTGNVPDEFVDDHRRMSKEYDEFKVRLDALFTKIPERSDAYNAEAKEGVKATRMADGTQWPGTWFDPAENHKKGQHAGIVKVMLNHPGDEPRFGGPASVETPLDFSAVDVRLPMLVYISREKNPSYDHQKKAGAMNVQLRVSALLTNAPFIINFDGDHYVNNSQAFRAAMCFMLDRRDGDNTAFVQFPQRFDDVDPTDRYCNHNRVFFDATLLGLNGIQGPSYVGTGCMFRRIAVYGIDPPRWRTDAFKLVDSPNKFGNSMPFINSIPSAANQEWSMTSPLAHEESVMEELNNVMKCAYEEGTDFGKEIGWVYNIATEDVVTGFRVHRTGWRSMYCRIEPDAFRGTAPINLTERLYQILRWSGGSLEMFFSHCPLLAGRRLNFMQRIAYTNMTAYPISSVFLVFYLLFPVIWIFRGEFYIQKPFPTYVLYLVIIIAMTELIGMVEIKWAGLTLLDWIRNEQFYIIGATAVYPLATLHIVLKLVLRGNGVSFKLTAKQATSTVNEKYAEMYVVQWAPLLIPTIVVIAVNVGAIGAAVGKAIVGGWSLLQMADASLGLVFNAWILLLIYPFALGIMGRWSKRPYILFILFMIGFVVVAAVVVAIHAARTGSFRFHFRHSGGASFPTSWGF